MMYGFHKIGYLPKPFKAELEGRIVSSLREIESISLEELQLMTQVFCRSRVGTRDFHKLLEMAILSRLDDLKLQPKILHSIGFELESSGLCSIDTIKGLKKVMFQIEVELDTF